MKNQLLTQWKDLSLLEPEYDKNLILKCLFCILIIRHVCGNHRSVQSLKLNSTMSLLYHKSKVPNTYITVVRHK